MAQSGLVARELERVHPGLEVELVPIVTTGDRTTGELAKLGGKGLFTKELERGLLDGNLELAVHSLKDLPVTLADGLRIAGFPRRADARDVLLSEIASSVEGLPQGARVLTGSLRRQAQLLRLRPDLVIEPIRGNVDTRIRKWRQGGAAGLILAAAGLARLGLEAGQLPIHPLAPASFIPAPGQGTLALETAEGSAAMELCEALNDPSTELASRAERSVVASLGGDCTLPLAAFCRVDTESLNHTGASGHTGAFHLTLSAFLSTIDGCHWVSDESSGGEPSQVAASVVESLRRGGADDILARLAG